MSQTTSQPNKNLASSTPESSPSIKSAETLARLMHASEVIAFGAAMTLAIDKGWLTIDQVSQMTEASIEASFNFLQRKDVKLMHRVVNLNNTKSWAVLNAMYDNLLLLFTLNNLAEMYKNDVSKPGTPQPTVEFPAMDG